MLLEETKKLNWSDLSTDTIFSNFLNALALDEITSTQNLTNFIELTYNKIQNKEIGNNQWGLIVDFLDDVGIKIQNKVNIKSINDFFGYKFDYVVEDFKNYKFSIVNKTENTDYSVISQIFFGQVDKSSYDLIPSVLMEEEARTKFASHYLNIKPEIQSNNLLEFIIEGYLGSVLLRHEVLQELFLLVSTKIRIGDKTMYIQLSLYDRYGNYEDVDINTGLKLAKLTPMALSKSMVRANVESRQNKMQMHNFDIEVLFMNGTYTTTLSQATLIKNKIRAFAYIFRRNHIKSLYGKEIYTYLFYGHPGVGTNEEITNKLLNNYTPYAPYPIDRQTILSYILSEKLDKIAKKAYKKLENTFILPYSFFSSIPSNVDIQLQSNEMEFFNIKQDSNSPAVMYFDSNNVIDNTRMRGVIVMFKGVFRILNEFSILNSGVDTNLISDKRFKIRKRHLFAFIFKFIDIEKWICLTKIKFGVPLMHSLIRIVIIEGGVNGAIPIDDDEVKDPYTAILCPRIAMSLQGDCPCLEAMFA